MSTVSSTQTRHSSDRCPFISLLALLDGWQGCIFRLYWIQCDSRAHMPHIVWENRTLKAHSSRLKFLLNCFDSFFEFFFTQQLSHTLFFRPVFWSHLFVSLNLSVIRIIHSEDWAIATSLLCLRALSLLNVCIMTKNEWFFQGFVFCSVVLPNLNFRSIEYLHWMLRSF